jgi:hypothetical protein
MSSGGNFSGTPNYGGRQPNTSSFVKTFVYSAQNLITWIYTLYENNSYLSPSTNTLPVLINNDLIVTGSIINNGAIVPSDRKLKKNIKEIDSELSDRILSLEPKQYTYIKDVEQKLHYGMIAQEMEEIYPDLVKTINGSKMINYTELIPILILKIKNMQKEINDLRDKL